MIFDSPGNCSHIDIMIWTVFVDLTKGCDSI